MVQTERRTERQKAERQIDSLLVDRRSASSHHTGDTEAFLVQRGKGLHGSVVQEPFGPQHDEAGTAKP